MVIHVTDLVPSDCVHRSSFLQTRSVVLLLVSLSFPLLDLYIEQSTSSNNHNRNRSTERIIMAPRSEIDESSATDSVEADKADGGIKGTFRSGMIKNEDIMEDAGKVPVDEARLWGKGIIGDFKETIGSHWVQEMTNFNQKTVAVSLLLFIAVITPTLTFGAVYGKVTGNLVGTVETILATSWVGCFYALFSGMPLVCKHVVLAMFVHSNQLASHISRLLL